jgi:hypothetical protein
MIHRPGDFAIQQRILQNYKKGIFFLVDRDHDDASFPGARDIENGRRYYGSSIIKCTLYSLINLINFLFGYITCLIIDPVK